MDERINREQDSANEPATNELATLMQFLPLAEQIETFWRQPANQLASTWVDHREINSVMLATSILPQQFLSV